MAANQPPELGPWGGQERCAERILVFAAVFIPLFTGACVMFIFLEIPSDDDAVFTVAITGITGLDEDVDVDLPTTTISPPPEVAALLSPVFNLTFQIDNTRNSYHDACVAGFSRADVSYGGAFLAGGSVPALCAGEFRSDRVAATASAHNVAVPRFLRDQLAAGDASVDVKVTMPRYCRHDSCGSAVFSCKPKIGGGMSPACCLDCPRSFSPYIFRD